MITVNTAINASNTQVSVERLLTDMSEEQKEIYTAAALLDPAIAELRDEEAKELEALMAREHSGDDVMAAIGVLVRVAAGQTTTVKLSKSVFQTWASLSMDEWVAATPKQEVIRVFAILARRVS